MILFLLSLLLLLGSIPGVEAAPQEQSRGLDPDAGDHIQVLWSDGKWYKATVIGLRGGRPLLNYPDEEEPLVLRKDEEWRYKQPTSTATVEDAVVLPSGSLQMGPCSRCGKTEPYPKPKKPKYLKQYMRDLLAKFQGLHSKCQPITAAQNAADGLATAAGGPATGSDVVDASTATVEDAVVLPSGSLQMGPCSQCGKTEPYPKPKKPKYLKQYMRDLLAKFQGLHSNCQPIAAAVRAKRP